MVNDDSWWRLSDNRALQNPLEDDHGYHGFPIKIAISWGLSSHPHPISSPWSPLKKLHSTMTRALFHLVHEMWRSSHRLACQKGLEMGDLKDNCHCNLGKMTPVDQFFFTNPCNCNELCDLESAGCTSTGWTAGQHSEILKSDLRNRRRFHFYIFLHPESSVEANDAHVFSKLQTLIDSLHEFAF